jgi:hypothetical protein
MNTVSRLGIAGLVLAGATACSSSSSGGSGGHGAATIPTVPTSIGAATGSTSTTSGGGETAQIRFLSVLPPGSPAVSVVTGNDATSGKTLLQLTPGTISDYTAIPIGGAQTFLVAGGHSIGTVSYPLDHSDRMTIVVGVGESADATTVTEFEEHNGTVNHEFGDIGTEQPTVPSGKALILANGAGNGSLVSLVDLGDTNGGCLPGPGQSASSREPVGEGVTNYTPDPGSLSLAFYRGAPCSSGQLTAPASVTLSAGQTAYVFTWFSDAQHLRLIFVPVAGGAPVISDPGPTLASSAPSEFASSR